MNQMRHDSVVHGVAANGALRGIGVRSTLTVDEARRRHDLWATAAAALGRALSATAMFGAMLKGDERVAVQIICQGPLESIYADSDSRGHVRGYARNPHVDFELSAAGKLDVARAIGEGTLYVTRDLGLKEPYTSSVPLISGELGQDFAYYLVKSEQTPSVVSLGVLVAPDFSVQAAGGFIIQALPGAEPNLLEQVEAHVKTLSPVSSIVDAGADAKDILQTVLGPWQATVLAERPLAFHCDCSHERFERALITLGAEEVQDMIDQVGRAELVCNFCNERYLFNSEQLQDILATIKNSAQ
ncbi:MAG TPA: Hsp33 family molecular chaperone HslO [Firmicutes bacterium]|jgi:molecular chaperone Hsp33|nr:Hsp33 family molecular chaperone HslO [Bacillota bacterium]